MFRLNLLLALAWTALTGDFAPSNFCIGFLLGSLAIGVGARRTEGSRYVAKVLRTVGFAGFFLWELIKASLRVAFDIVTPRHRARPAVVAVPLDVREDAQITLLANLITLTPGTLSLDVSEDRRTLFVHVTYLTDREHLITEIKQGLERRVLEVTQ